MRSIPESDLCLTGATQQPLLDGNQLVPGAIVTGIAWQHVWEVVERDPADPTKVIIKMFKAQPEPIHSTHTWTAQDGGFESCTCGCRRQVIAGLLPARINAPRTVVLAPVGPLVVPDHLTVYVTLHRPRAQFHTVHGGPNAPIWGGELPIIPLLYPLWTPPAELRGMIGDVVEEPSED